MILKLLHSDFFIRKMAVYAPGAKEIPSISYVIPVYNQESVIKEHLAQIIENSLLTHEFIIINDSSTDNSRQIILEFIADVKSRHNSNSMKTLAIIFYETRIPWYETKCDDFGIRAARSNFVIEIQADMKIRDKYFDQKLINVISKDKTLFAISGRGTHKISELSTISERRWQNLVKIYYLFRNKISVKRHLQKFAMLNPPVSVQSQQAGDSFCQELVTKIFPSSSAFESHGRAGFLGTLIEKVPYEGENPYTMQIESNSEKIWIGETIMRGPLLLRKDYYERLGGFNSRAFFLGNDDHDLFIRAKEIGLKVGYSPIFFSSPLNLGSTRKNKKFTSQLFYLFNSLLREKSFFESSFYRVTKDY